jgi:hypothetical protein
LKRREKLKHFPYTLADWKKLRVILFSRTREHLERDEFKDVYLKASKFELFSSSLFAVFFFFRHK